MAERVGGALKAITVYKARKVDKLIRSIRFMGEVGMRKATSPLKVLHDPETDILYFHFADGEVEEVLEAGDVVVELGKEGRIVGVEVWGASRRGVVEELRRVVAAAQARGGEPVKAARGLVAEIIIAYEPGGGKRLVKLIATAETRSGDLSELAQRSAPR